MFLCLLGTVIGKISIVRDLLDELFFPCEVLNASCFHRLVSPMLDQVNNVRDLGTYECCFHFFALEALGQKLSHYLEATLIVGPRL